MNCKLKPGERVRVANTNRASPLGNTGIIKEGPYPAPHGGQYYIVQMDIDTGSGPAIVMADELEVAD